MMMPMGAVILIMCVSNVIVTDAQRPDISFETIDPVSTQLIGVDINHSRKMSVGFEEAKRTKLRPKAFRLSEKDGNQWRLSLKGIQGDGQIWLHGMNKDDWVYAEIDDSSKIEKLVSNPVCGIVMNTELMGPTQYNVTADLGCIQRISTTNEEVPFPAFCSVSVWELPKEPQSFYSLRFSKGTWSNCAVYLVPGPPCLTADPNPNEMTTLCYGNGLFAPASKIIARCPNDILPVFNRWFKLVPKGDIEQCKSDNRDDQTLSSENPRIAVHGGIHSHIWTLNSNDASHREYSTKDSSNGLFHFEIKPTSHHPAQMTASRQEGDGSLILFNLDENRWIDSTFQWHDKVEHTITSRICGLIVTSNEQWKTKYHVNVSSTTDSDTQAEIHGSEMDEFYSDCSHRVEIAGSNYSIDPECTATLFQLPKSQTKTSFRIRLTGDDWSKCKFYVYPKLLCGQSNSVSDHPSKIAYANKPSFPASLLIIECQENPSNPFIIFRQTDAPGQNTSPTKQPDITTEQKDESSTAVVLPSGETVVTMATADFTSDITGTLEFDKEFGGVTSMKPETPETEMKLDANDANGSSEIESTQVTFEPMFAENVSTTDIFSGPSDSQSTQNATDLVMANETASIPKDPSFDEQKRSSALVSNCFASVFLTAMVMILITTEDV